MRRLSMLIGLLMAISVSALHTQAQTQTHTLVGIHSRHLAGIITDMTGKPVPGEVIEDCDSTFTKVYAATKSDEQGNFSFAHAKLGSTHYLRMDFYELNRELVFDPMHLTIKIRLFAKTKVFIKLFLAT
jgi:hypothetical protein